MKQLTDISLSTAVICLGIYFIVVIARFVASKVWAATDNKWVRGTIKWVGTMWIPIWPIIIGSLMVRYVDGIPIPDAIKELVGDHPRSPVLGIYGAFCGLISMAVVKQVKDALAKKGIDVSIADPVLATLDAEKKLMDKRAEKAKNGKKSDPPKSDPDQDDNKEDEDDKE
jgi:hypothetical protein